jgi:hypothetical protein
MWERYAAGRDVEHWRKIHDRLNDPDQTVQPAPEPDAALRAYIAAHGCGGCG